jgi:hypothetical protein
LSFSFILSKKQEAAGTIPRPKATCVFLRWHYPDQVRGLKENPFLSRQASTPWIQFKFSIAPRQQKNKRILKEIRLKILRFFCVPSPAAMRKH